MGVDLSVGVVHIVIAGTAHGIVLGVSLFIEHPVERIPRIAYAEIPVAERNEYHERPELLPRIRTGRRRPEMQIVLQHGRSSESHAAARIGHHRGSRDTMGIAEAHGTENTALLVRPVHRVMGLYPRRYEFRPLYLRIIEHTVFGHEVVAVHRRNIVEPFVTVQTHGHGRPVGLLDPDGPRIRRYGTQLPPPKQHEEEGCQRFKSIR